MFCFSFIYVCVCVFLFLFVNIYAENIEVKLKGHFFQVNDSIPPFPGTLYSMSWCPILWCYPVYHPSPEDCCYCWYTFQEPTHHVGQGHRNNLWEICNIVKCLSKLCSNFQTKGFLTKLLFMVGIQW